jgi:hypothetical protein
MIRLAHAEKEKRKYPRLEACCAVWYKPECSLIGYDMTMTKNISRGGALITTGRVFEARTVLMLLAKFPFAPQTKAKIRSIVVSCEKAREHIYNTRVRFLSMDSAMYDELVKFIRERLIQLEDVSQPRWR